MRQKAQGRKLTLGTCDHPAAPTVPRVRRRRRPWAVLSNPFGVTTPNRRANRSSPVRPIVASSRRMDAPEPPSTPPPPLRSVLAPHSCSGWPGPGASACRPRPRACSPAATSTPSFPGKVYRSGAVSRGELRRVIAEKKIRTVINLRGCCPDMDWYHGRGPRHARDRHQPGRHHALREALPASRRNRPPDRGVRPHRLPGHPPLRRRGGPHRAGRAIALLLLTDATSPRPGGNCGRGTGTSRVGRTAVLDEFFDYYEAGSRPAAKPHTPDASAAGSRTDYCPGPFRAELAVLAPVPLAVPARRGSRSTIRATNRRSSRGRSARRRGRSAAAVHAAHEGRASSSTAGTPGCSPGRCTPASRSTSPPGSRRCAAGPYMLHADLLNAQPIDLLDTDFAQYGSEPLIARCGVKQQHGRG